ncbi:aliphatic sulfonate ABC transporter substrate-binding protein [Hyphomicrobium sp. DY-1]|jgi:NitT/TauT family transport system substrate-binding protein|uniref:aliphatic sulfonate ABC transporter substrate-binding protein n=1 Tax=Hyphomicrobium sp. DY-1 TaxID=3075650 RepID=UPI0039C34EE2
MKAAFRVLAVSLALGLSALTCSAVNADALKPYKVGYNSWIGYISLFIAKEKGFFKDEGLDLQMQSFSSPGDGLAPLLGGQLDAHFTTADSVITALDKAPGRLEIVYMTDTSAGADAILAKSDIATPADLKGKTVAATAGQCNELLLRKALAKYGLVPSDIKLTNMNPDDAGAAFAAGKLDAAVTWEPWITKVQGEKKGHVIFSSKEAPNLILDVVAISDKTAKDKADETKAFLRALNKANELAIADPKAASEIAAKSLELKPEEVLDMLPKVKLYGATDNVAQMKGPAIEVGKELAAFFKEVKVNDGVVDTSNIFNPSFIGK